VGEIESEGDKGKRREEEEEPFPKAPSQGPRFLRSSPLLAMSVAIILTQDVVTEVVLNQRN